jgi:hypothetical protein
VASKQRADKQKEKEKKEKIILLVLVAVMVVVGALELPKMLKKSGSATSSVALTTSTSSATSSSGTPTSASATPGSLPNSNGYKAGAGQLSRFSLFNTKDPFGSATTPSSESATTSSNTTTNGKTRSTTITIPQGKYVAARISVNGTLEDIALKAAFPSASPVFTLDSVTAKKIEISVAGGSFQSGQSKVAIGKGKRVTLENTADSTRYVIKFVTALTTSSPTSGATTSTTSASTVTGTTS